MPEPNDFPFDSTRSPARYNGFLALVLIALSFIVLLGWELVIASQTRTNGRRLIEQQAKTVEQSKTVQGGLEKIARDLVEVARNDDDAKAIVAKYNINISNPAPTATP